MGSVAPTPLFIRTGMTQCSICFEVPKSTARLVPCGHEFCSTCIVPWTVKRQTCPLCREPIRQCGESIDDWIPSILFDDVTMVSTLEVDKKVIRIRIPSLEAMVFNEKAGESLHAFVKRTIAFVSTLWSMRYPDTQIRDMAYLEDINEVRDPSQPFTRTLFVILRTHVGGYPYRDGDESPIVRTDHATMLHSFRLSKPDEPLNHTYFPYRTTTATRPTSAWLVRLPQPTAEVDEAVSTVRDMALAQNIYPEWSRRFLDILQSVDSYMARECGPNQQQ